MSSDLSLYLPRIDDAYIVPWIEQLNTIDMRCAIHPDFSLINSTGFLPFKIQLLNSIHKEFVGQSFVTGFEYDCQDFDYQKMLAESKPKKTLFERIMGKVTSTPYHVSPEIDARLSTCKKNIFLSWGSCNLFEYRMALLSAAILSQLTGGVFHLTSDDVWYGPDTQRADLLGKITEHEVSLKEVVQPPPLFERWLG